jgi:hypothetical protein
MMYGVWDPMPDLTITSPYDDSKTCTMSNPMSESTLFPIQELRIWPLFFPFKKLFEELVFPSRLWQWQVLLFLSLFSIEIG